MPHPTHPTPRVGGGGGEGEWGTWGWGGRVGHWGRGYEKNIVYIVIHTHVLVSGLRWEKDRKSSDSFSYSTIFNNFTGKMNAKPARSQLDRSQTHISQFFSSDYGDPLINRTVPLGGAVLVNDLLRCFCFTSVLNHDGTQLPTFCGRMPCWWSILHMSSKG
jgi:hypothetical protein